MMCLPLSVVAARLTMSLSFERRSRRVQSVVRVGSEWFRGISFVCINQARLDDLAIALALLCPWHLDTNTHALEDLHVQFTRSSNKLGVQVGIGDVVVSIFTPLAGHKRAGFAYPCLLS